MKLLYFAWLKTKTGMAEEDVTPPEGVATVGELLTWLEGRGAPGHGTSRGTGWCRNRSCFLQVGGKRRFAMGCAGHLLQVADAGFNRRDAAFNPLNTVSGIEAARHACL